MKLEDAMRVGSMFLAIAVSVGAAVVSTAPAAAMPVQSAIQAGAPQESIDQVGYYGGGGYYGNGGYYRHYHRHYYAPRYGYYPYVHRYGYHSYYYPRRHYYRGYGY